MLVCVAALALAGCKNVNQLFEGGNESGFSAKSIDIFKKPDWASGSVDATTVSLGPSGPVAPENLVGADGHCALPVVAQAPQAAGQAPQVAAAAAAPQGLELSGPQVMGGIALGMTECEAVRRAGLPSNVSIGVGEKSERKVVLTYLGGTWPGIYHFAAGRLKEIEIAPTQSRPAPVKKKPSKKKPRTAASQAR